MSRTTILDAAVQVLAGERAGLSAKDIHERIVARSLFTFKARDPVGVLRAAVQKHLRTHGGDDQPPALLRKLGRDLYALS
ncbi:MAG: hypothetical protein DYH12_11445 [Sorangiineae bacterium PRO1]|nr:hypothetical protein [Sorangiineae bacterium PRO1]